MTSGHDRSSAGRSASSGQAERKGVQGIKGKGIDLGEYVKKECACECINRGLWTTMVFLKHVV